ncbi:MAG: family 16 glycosylhydrolase [Omnitrophica WOR_2 bacterium]
MKRIGMAIALLFVVLLPFWKQAGRISGGAPAAAQASISGGPVGQDPASWTMTFNDEFDGTALDRIKWRSDYWNGGNGELQEYVNDDSHNNYIEQNGILSLVARREYYQGKNYTSGIITTQERFFQTYGFFEMRAKMPPGKGLWPAFWLMPNPTGWPPEIDVLEFLGSQLTTIYMSLHGNSGSSQSYYTGPDFSADFHTFGVKWAPDSMVWYIDGVARKTYTTVSNIPNIPMFIIANLAVGGSWPGSPDANTVFPAYFDIDYIRVWTASSSPAPTPTDTPVPDLTATPTETSIPTETPTPTAIPPGDTTPPAVSIVRPIDGSGVLIKSSVTIEANASDDQGIASVEFYVNGSLRCTDTAVPYTCAWKVPASVGVRYAIDAKAYDLSGNTAVSTVTVTSRR